MKAFLALYRRLDLIQRSFRFHLAATVLAVLACGGYFGAVLVAGYSFSSDRQALTAALSNQNHLEGDPVAVSLYQTGTVVVNGKTYGGEAIKRNADLMFDENGALQAPAAVAIRLMQDERPTWAPSWLMESLGTTWLLFGVTLVWLLIIIWTDITLPFLLTLLGTAVPVGIAWLLEMPQLMLAFGGIGLLTFTWVALTRVVLIIYQRPRQILAVAHTVIKEASRSRISLTFIILLLVILPLIPLWLDTEQPLRFQIQTFISRSLSLTFFLAACLTLFLACSTVAFEIRDRQIWQLMTKPVSRVNYLIGKWLGVVTVNLILLAVSGVSTFTFIQFLRDRPVASGTEGQYDALAVTTEVLTARRSRFPTYERLNAQQLDLRVEQLIRQRPELATLDEVPLAELRKLRREIHEAYQLSQRWIPPQTFRNFTFYNLQEAKARDVVMTLRYRFHILRSDEHETYQAVFWVNDDRNATQPRTYVPTMSHVLQIPTQLIRDDGSITISVFNAYEPPPDKPDLGALNFEYVDFELLYKVGNFEPNFLKAVMINWVKLSFLAMLGVCCATFLNFAVSCLLSFTVFAAGSLGPFLADSLVQWYPPATSQMDWGNIGLVIRWAFQWFIKIIAELLVWSLSGFGELSPNQRLVEGKFISWMEVIIGFAKLGLLWSGAILVVGYFVMRGRQLAIYSGHG